MPQDRPSLGEYFRSERERMGLDLKEIEEKTKISAQTLIFLEEDRMDMLPPRAFLRGFLRVISKEFHFDEEELLARLEETLAEHDLQVKNSVPLPYKARSTRFMLLVVSVAVLIAIALVALSVRHCSRQQDWPEPAKQGQKAASGAAGAGIVAS
jgi:cytoskeletal protein RodZ